MEKVELPGFSTFTSERWKRWKTASSTFSRRSDSKRARTLARVEGNYCYRSSSYLSGKAVFQVSERKDQTGAIRLAAAPVQPFAQQGGEVIDPVRAEHDGHAVVIASDSSGGWRVCLDCPSFIHRVTFCGTTTKRGRTCRIAVRPDLGQTSCPAHRKAS